MNQMVIFMLFFGRGDMADSPGMAIARTTTSCWDLSMAFFQEAIYWRHLPYIWVNYNDCSPSLESWFRYRGIIPKLALIQVGELL